jgi:nitrite reductase/ring-hydroxylating ferredoxin subunit
VVHALANSAGLVFQIASWSARRRGHHVRGKVLSSLALGAVSAGGYLGGHLVFHERVGVDVDVPMTDARGWRYACRSDELVDGHPHGVTIDGVRVVVVRDLGRVYALAATCPHAGGPLDEGAVDGCVIECPWHGSKFRLDDGGVQRGPAAAPQPFYGVRERDGVVEIRRVVGADSTGDSPTYESTVAEG